MSRPSVADAPSTEVPDYIARRAECERLVSQHARVRTTGQEVVIDVVDHHTGGIVMASWRDEVGEVHRRPFSLADLDLL
ncbi:hypothetical protein [Methylorubrum populi]|uniref:Uncharacterized protein n=1 Tax=Methylorubrum populi TaxID=223967 RepID=A0A833JA34_9HYPH|nr:hypothetical protein [Methylorubrum populi]KAB7788058.1 hypothetical protein F8B43_0063 [Methylorubrum populi]